MCTVIGYEKRKARKKHVCDLCGAPINKGEIYSRWVSVDGYMCESKVHHNCEIAIGDYCSDAHEQEWHPDYVQDFMIQTLKSDGVVVDWKTVSYHDIVNIYHKMYHEEKLSL